MDFRRVFLTYLEAPNSILAKNKEIGRILLNLSIFPLSPCLGSLGLLSFLLYMEHGGADSRRLPKHTLPFWAPGWPLAWPGPQDGLGQGGLRLKWAKGRFWSKFDEKVKVLRMSLPNVESLSGLQESVFSLFRGLQLNSRKKSKN